MRWLAGLLYASLLFLCLAAGVLGRVALRMGEVIAGPGKDLGKVWRGISNPRSLFPGKDRLVVLLVGQDYNRTREGIAYTKRSRADTIMLIGVDLERRKLSACSVPRDTFVRAPDGVSGKINGTFARGGIELLKATLADLLGIVPDYHVVIKPSAVRTIVDAVGGVRVESIDEMRYDDSWGGLHINLPKGRMFLNGEQAEGFVRFREVNRYRIDERGRRIPLRNVRPSLEEGDIRRTARQQQMIGALIAAANTPANWLQLDAIIDVGFSQVETDMERTQLLALASLFRGQQGLGLASATLAGRGEMRGGAYYYIVDPDEAKDSARWLILGDLEAGLRLVTVRVDNASEVPGLARRCAADLEGLGYRVAVGERAEPIDVTTIEYGSAAFESLADRLRQDLGLGSLVKASPEEQNRDPALLRVRLGRDAAPRFAPTAASKL